ncbi:MAG: hypothetical protein ACYDCS_12325 [Candidatus Dormibacteria bacterium]
MLSDGRRVDQARDGTAPAAVAIRAPTVSLAPLTVGTDWISIARWITIAYGALQVLGIFAVGLLIPSITVPVQDPTTGVIVDQTLNIRPFLALVAVVAIVFFAIIVWLTKYGIARGIVLVVVLLEALAAVSRMGSEQSTAVAASVVSLLCDAGFAYVLVMTFVSRPQPAPVATGVPATLPMAPPPPPPPPTPPPLSPFPSV